MNNQESAIAFEEPIVIGANLNKEVSCLNCDRKGTTENFLTYAGKGGSDIHLCSDCKTIINIELEKETTNYNWFGVIGMGIIAAIIGGAVWYYITISSGKEFGYVAIGLGYLIGIAIIQGSGQKRGFKLQIVAGILTLVAIFLSEYAIFTHLVNEYIIQNPLDFPGAAEHGTYYPSIIEPEFLTSLVSPIGLIIYAIGAYVAYLQPKARTI